MIPPMEKSNSDVACKAATNVMKAKKKGKVAKK